MSNFFRKKVFTWCLVALGVLFSVLLLNACIKTVTVGDPLEATLNAGTANISLTPNFPVTVTLTSKVPPMGTTIYVTVLDEASNTAITPQVPAFTTTASVSSFNIINLPQQKWCIVNIKLVEVNNKNNTLTKSFRVIYK